MVKPRQPYWLNALYHKDLPRYVNPHDPMVKAVERGRWALMSSNKGLVYGETSLIGALVRYEPAFQHYDLFADSPALPVLGTLGTVIEGEWVVNRKGSVPCEDFWFRDILWYGFGYSKQTEWLTKTVRVIALAGEDEDATRR